MMTRYFALAVGIVYTLVGVMGLLGLGLTATTHPGLAVEAQSGLLLGLFPVNILHNIVHLLIGIWGIVAYRSYGGARAFAQALAVLYGLLAIMGLLPQPFNTTFGLVPIFGLDVWLHALTALVAAYFGFVHRDDDYARTGGQAIDASRTRR